MGQLVWGEDMRNFTAVKISPTLLFTIGTALLLITVATLWFFANFEKKEFEETGSMSPAAYNNPYLAAAKYLTKTGLEAEGVRGLDLFSEPPPHDNTIFVAHMPVGLSTQMRDTLLGWVDRGGHLMFVPNRNEGANPNSPDFSELIGFKLSPDSSDEENCGCSEEEDSNDDATGDASPLEEDQEPDTESEEETEEDDGYHPVEGILHIGADGHKLEIEHNGYLSLEDTYGTAAYKIPAGYFLEYINDEDKTREDHNQFIEQENNWLLRYNYGRGVITVFSDTVFLTNSHIDKRDHAFFLSHLVGDSGKIWFIYSSTVDSFFMSAWKRSPSFWVSLAALLLAILWMYQMRTGPLKTGSSADHRNILGHIDATADYHWRTDNCRHIIEANRRHFLQGWQKRKQGTGTEAETSTVDPDVITKRTGLTNEEVVTALQSPYKSEQEFIRSSRAMQKFSNALHDGEKKHKD